MDGGDGAIIDYGKQNVLGIRIDAVDHEAATERIVGAARSRKPLGVSAMAVHGVMTGVLDREHRYRLNRLEMVVPDGQPVRWAIGWLHDLRLPDRVYGPKLMLEVCERAAAQGLPIYLFGGTPEMVEQLEENLRERFPRLEIAGAKPSLFRRMSPAERDQAVAEIRDSGAAITFAGLGCPRQEVWAFETRRALSMPVVAIGAAFAFHAGMHTQAPASWQRHGFEWLYRLLREPLRLWRRYVLLNPLYLAMIALQWSGLRAFDPEDADRPAQELLYG